MKVLVLGGTGFLSGAVVSQALAAGHDVWALTRGKRPARQGVEFLTADRLDREKFQKVIGEAQVQWDLVIDCIGFSADDAKQDLEVFSGRAAKLVFISSDFALSPIRRPWMVDESYDRFDTTSYGAGKRAAEEVLLAAPDGHLEVVILRPPHIYGPGAHLGCLPHHGRDPNLLDKMRAGESLRLVGGGHFLQQPVFSEDLAAMALSCANIPALHRQLFMAAGPDVIASWQYYEILANALNVPLTIEEAAISDFLSENPAAACFCCHRVYDMTKARNAGLAVPASPISTLANAIV